MTLNEVVSNVRKKIRRGLHRNGGKEIQVVTPNARLEQLGNAPLATPGVDVYENDKELLILADVPGGTREGATVVWDQALGLSFRVKNVALPSGSLWASEYSPCDWYRAFKLPPHADGSKAASAIQDGVLTIRIPKRTAGSKLIPVTSGSENGRWRKGG